ncbi:ABC transporter permease [Streptomyces zhihengii]
MGGADRSTLTRQLLAVGRNAGRRTEAGGVRFIALLLATLVLSVGLAGIAAVHAVYAGKEERRAARTPVASDAKDGAAGSTRWLVNSDSLEGERRFSLVFLSPHAGDAPLPPGVDRWPGPGEVVLSPALRAAGASEGIDRRYGRPAGTIGASGLDEPTEWLAYVRPRDGVAPAESDIVSGFGPSAGTITTGLEPGFGRQDDKPEFMFQAAVLGMLVLPALALLFVAARTGAHARDRRTALVTALGGRRSDRALVSLGEAARPALLGALLGAPAVAASLLRDLRIPYTDYVLSAAYMRGYGWWAGLTPLAALVVVLTAVVLVDLARRQTAAGTRPHGARGARLALPAALCPLMVLLAALGPDLAGRDSAVRMLISWAGVAGTVITLPAAVAVLTAAAGRVLTRRGQKHGLAGTLVAGRRTSTHPGATARMVTGITIALIVLMQAAAWQGLFGSQSAEAQQRTDRVGRSLITVGARGTVPPEAVRDFLERVPDTDAVLLVPPADRTAFDKPVILHGSCEALANLRLPCPATAARVDGVPDDPRLRELLQGTMLGKPILEVRRSDAHDIAAQAAAAAEEPLRLAVLSRGGKALSVPALKQLASDVLPRGAQIAAPGEDEVTAGVPNRDQGRWSALLGVIGIAVLALTASLTGMSEFLRHGRALAPLSVLTGGLSVFRTSSAWSVLAPLALAGLVGSVVASRLAAPVSAGGESYISPELRWSAMGVVLLVSVLMWQWATTVAVRQAHAWRPRGD